MKNAVERIFSCKISFWYSRERARQKFAKFSKNAFSKNAFSKNTFSSPGCRNAAEAAGPPQPSAPQHGAQRRGPGPAPASPIRGGDVRQRRLAKIRQNVARFRLYRLRFLQENMRFAAFFKIYQILSDSQAEIFEIKFDKNFAIFATFAIFLLKFHEKLIAVFQTDFFAKILRLQRCKRMQIL